MRSRIFWAVFLVLGFSLIAPFVIYPVFLMKVLCFALFACGFNFLLGYVGLLSFGHAAFFSLAAYTTGLATINLKVTPEVGILIGTGAATLLGFVIGWLAIRRSGIYFSMITLALAQMLYFIYLQAPFTGGEDGLQGVPRGRLFGFIDLGNNLYLYYTVLAIFIGGFCLAHRAVHSPFGHVLQAIRENEPRAISLGYEVNRYKLLAFVFSSALAGLAGSMKTLVLQLASLADAHWHLSGEVVLMTLLGGMGFLIGPVVGAALVVTLQSYLSAGPLASFVPVILGSCFVICVMSFRRGIVGEIRAAITRYSGSAKSRPTVSAASDPKDHGTTSEKGGSISS
jgi:branched-chain amino acid transport system permease protein